MKTYPVTRWGRIDWNVIPEKYFVASVNDMVDILDSMFGSILDHKVHLLWNYSNAPSIQVSLEQVVKYIDDVTAVGGDTWVLGPDLSYVIEFFHEGGITVGLRIRED